MRILAFDFSCSQRTVALLRKGEAGASSVSEAVDTAGTAANAFAMTESVLRQAGIEREQVDCIAVGLGPGSYTGIRASIAVAQGWELAANIKLAGVNSADCVAAAAAAQGLDGPIAVVIDAQRQEFYFAEYQLDPPLSHNKAPLKLASREEVLQLQQRGSILVGPEVDRWFAGGRIVFPRAWFVAEIALGAGRFVTGADLEPIYLRQTTFVKAAPPRLLPE